MLFNLYVSIHSEGLAASRPQAIDTCATTKSYLNKLIGSSACIRVMAQRHVVGLLQYISLGLSQVLRDGAETIAGAVKSRKARKLTPPRK